MRILFVCSGNICRSPTAEGVMRHLVRERGIDGVEVASAGIGGWHVGEPADRRSAEAARRRGIALDGAAQQVGSADFEDYDLLVAMDRSHLHDLQAMAGGEHRSKVRLLIDGTDVPDPYYGGPDGFDDVLDLVTEGCERLLDDLADAGGRASTRT